MQRRKTKPNAAELVNHVNIVITGKSSPSSERAPAIAKMMINTNARADWATDPPTGAWLRGESLARAAGSTRARPIEKKYRAAALWKAMSAANRLVMNTTLARSVNNAIPCASRNTNMRSGPYSRDMSTTAEGPTPMDNAQAEKA